SSDRYWRSVNAVTLQPPAAQFSLRHQLLGCPTNLRLPYCRSQPCRPVRNRNTSPMGWLTISLPLSHASRRSLSSLAIPHSPTKARRSTSSSLDGSLVCDTSSRAACGRQVRG